jgi:hypothetical protein
MENQKEASYGAQGVKGKSSWKWILLSIVILIIATVLIYLFFFDGWAKVEQRWVEKNPSPNIPSSLDGGQNKISTNSDEYSKFIGTWATDCLVPDANSPWAEKHSFIFESSGTAKHIRWSGDSCGTLKEDEFNQSYKIEIPEVGKINFLADGSGSETMYDIYEFNGTKLYFGHGFRTTYPPGMVNFGRSENTRFDSLNTFIEYKK